MRRLLFLLLIGLFAQLLVSCYPEGADNTEDYDVAMTTYDRDKDASFFAGLTTYSMPDTIVYFVSKNDEINGGHQFDQAILQLVESEFNALGYQRIQGSETDKPDFIVTVSAFSNVNYYFVYNNWYNYWGWYPGWDWFGWGYYPGWNWPSFGPYYPWGSLDLYSYRSGSIVIDMLDPSNVTESSNKIPVLWSGIAVCIIAGSTDYILQRAETQIRQCFIQSPYLGK